MAGLDVHLAENRIGAPLDLGIERGAGERAKALGFVGGDDADEARPRAGQGNQSERPVGGVEFGRNVVVRARMGEREGEGGLRIGAAVQRNAGGGAADRVAPVGPDGEPAIERCAVRESGGDAGIVDADRLRGGCRVGEGRHRGDAVPQGGDQMSVLDIPGERFEPDLGRVKAHLGCAPQPAGVVHDAHHPQRRRMGAAARPYAERFERLNGRRHQGGGAIVDAVGPRRDEHGRHPEMRERQRRHEAGGAAADHRGSGLSGCPRRYGPVGFGMLGHRFDPPGARRSRSLNKRRRQAMTDTADAIASFLPTSSTRRLAGVIPV